MPTAAWSWTAAGSSSMTRHSRPSRTVPAGWRPSGSTLPSGTACLALGLADSSDASLLNAFARQRPVVRAAGTGTTAGRPTAISFDGVTTVRDGRGRVLDGISCSIGAGEFVALVGRNGAGKSTFAGHLIGFLRPTTGTVRIDGKNAADMPIAALARHVGYLFQNPDNQLFMDTVAREIGFGLNNYGVDDVDGRVSRAMERAGLTAFADRPPQAVSRGQRQRVAVASILAMEPAVLVLDEPTTGQDRGHLHALLGEMVELHRAGRTVLLITHDLTLMAEYAERVLVMDAGRLVFDGTPETLFYESDVLGFLGGSPRSRSGSAGRWGWTGH